MIKRDQLTKFLNIFFGKELIEEARKKDEYMPNGLQWKGKDEIKKLIIGVNADVDFFNEAVKAEGDALLAHHGLPLDIPYKLYSSSLQKRLEILARKDLSLYAYHYILDCHPKVGNNAQIIKKLGAKKTKETIHEGWGWIAEFDKAQDIDKLAKKCAKIFSHDIFVVKAKKEKVKRIGVVSGRGVPFLEKKLALEEKNIDLYLTGEISQWNPAEFKEMGIAYFSCGHYATEIFGVQALGKTIKEEFKNRLEVEFIDLPNPL
jgi:dinuclear metal center YbgI/SA1388 family protein